MNIRNLRTTAVYWPPSTATADGKPALGTPVEYNYPCGVRWEDVISETIGPQGDVVLSSSRVYLLQHAQVGGRFYKGCLADATASGFNPLTERSVREIINVSRMETLKGETALTIVSLK